MKNDLPTCALAAGAGLRSSWDELPALRKTPGVYRGESLFKHVRSADEQTVAAVAAVARAVDAAGWNDRSFANWGVLAAPRALGRHRFLGSLDRFRKLGAKSVSPLITPTLSLHAVAGVVSIALQMNGPHYGVSGHGDHIGEALLAGLALMAADRLEGVWIVVSELDPEPTITPSGDVLGPTTVQAAALALTPAASGHEVVLLSGAAPPSTAAALVAWLLSDREQAWRCPATGVGVLELRRRQLLRLAG